MKRWNIRIKNKRASPSNRDSIIWGNNFEKIFSARTWFGFQLNISQHLMPNGARNCLNCIADRQKIFSHDHISIQEKRISFDRVIVTHRSAL